METIQKWQALFLGMVYLRYKRADGTRWVEHQVIALKSHLKNLPIFIGFTNQQTTTPHNKQMKDSKATIEGINKKVCQTVHVVFQALKLDVLTVILPLSKIMQAVNLLTPEYFTACSTTVDNIAKVKTLLESLDGPDYESDDIVFTNTKSIMEQLIDESETVVPLGQTRSDRSHNPGSNYSLFHD